MRGHQTSNERRAIRLFEFHRFKIFQIAILRRMDIKILF
jgi:hypothetical protein